MRLNKHHLSFLTIFIFIFGLSTSQAQTSSTPETKPSTNLDIGQIFYDLLVTDDEEDIEDHLNTIEENWDINLIPMSLEAINYAYAPKVRTTLVELIEAVVPKESLADNNKIFEWVWNQELEAPTGYANFKAQLYGNIDERFHKYFYNRQDLARIRLDEVRWGGVIQDGIPPLRNPEMVSVKEASYLGDDNIVFGIEINGDARAYPKRILAWHEMFTAVSYTHLTLPTILLV